VSENEKEENRKDDDDDDDNDNNDKESNLPSVSAYPISFYLTIDTVTRILYYIQ